MSLAAAGTAQGGVLRPAVNIVRWLPERREAYRWHGTVEASCLLVPSSPEPFPSSPGWRASMRWWFRCSRVPTTERSQRYRHRIEAEPSRYCGESHEARPVSWRDSRSATQLFRRPFAVADGWQNG